MQPRLFWPLIVVGSILESVAAASFTAALFSDPVPRRVVEYHGPETEIFGRVTSLDWTSDRGLLISAITCFALGVAAYAAAARLR